jgi:hypothetical protein
MSEPTLPHGGLGAAEANLGRALVLLQRAAVRLDDPAHRADVQNALRQAASLIESARKDHESSGALASPLGTHAVATAVGTEIAAVIAAAVAVVIDRPHRLVAVQQVSVPVVPHLNVWAVEGRTQIFMSHRIR